MQGVRPRRSSGPALTNQGVSVSPGDIITVVITVALTVFLPTLDSAKRLPDGQVSPEAAAEGPLGL